MMENRKKFGVDVLLVTPPSRQGIYQMLGGSIAAIETPVWSMLMATFMRRHGFSVALLDGEAEGLSFEETASQVADINPALTVFVVYGQQPSASTQCMYAGREVCRLLNEKSLDFRTIVMGTHASALPRRTLQEEPYTFVCQGEGPYTILGLLERIKAGSTDYSSVPGLWYQCEGQVRSSPPAPKIINLDEEMAGQSWDLVSLPRYRAHNWHCFDHIDERQPYASIQTSLGCPYKCSFCCINAPFGGSGIRYWSTDLVLKQIEFLVEEHGVKNIKIPDEMFVLNERHVLGICDGIIERGYDLNIWAYARVDTVKDKFLEKLRKAGFRWLALGIESGSKHVRDGVEKGRFGDHDIEVTVKRIQNAGIYVLGNYIFGLPDDTKESMQETLDLAKNLNTEWANFYSAMAYPGSQLYDLAIQNKWPLPESWVGYSQHSYEALPLPTESLSGHDVLAFRDQAHISYFSSTPYLNMVEKKFGNDIVNHIHGMLGIKLNRKYLDSDPNIYNLTLKRELSSLEAE